MLDTEFFQLLTGSYGRLVGEPLIAPGHDARWLHEKAPFAVLAHNTDEDPRFIYANKTAQQCFEYSWDEFVQLRSRFSAEQPDRAERQAPVGCGCIHRIRHRLQRPSHREIRPSILDTRRRDLAADGRRGRVTRTGGDLQIVAGRRRKRYPLSHGRPVRAERRRPVRAEPSPAVSRSPSCWAARRLIPGSAPDTDPTWALQQR